MDNNWNGNKHAGRMEFQALGQTWKLHLTMNDLVRLQAAMGFDDDHEQEFLNAIGGQMRGPSSIRKRFAQMLRLQQPEITDDTVGDIVTEIGMPGALRLINETLAWTFPKDPAKGKEKAPVPAPESEPVGLEAVGGSPGTPS